MKSRNLASQAVAAMVTFGAATCVGAAPITFAGIDDNVNAGQARPNSDAAAASFDAAAGALGGINLIDFESAATSSPASAMTLATGVTYTPSNHDSFSGIFNTNQTNLGYNTTAGGSQHLRYSSGTSGALDAVFSFAIPIQAFGAYFTGINFNATDILFNDGTSQSFTLNGQNDGVQFFGFTDAGVLISSVTLRGNIFDVFGVDDIRFVNVPEPASLALLGLGLAGLALSRRKRA